MQGYEEGEDNIIDMELYAFIIGLCLCCFGRNIHNRICLKMITFVCGWLNGNISMYISPFKDVFV